MAPESADPQCPPADVPARDWRFALAAAAIVAVAAAVRFYRLGAYELWMDEGVSFQMATVDPFGAALLRENSPPVYYVLQRLWLLPFGESVAALRSLSALAGTLFVAALIRSGRTFLGPAVGLWSGALAALSPLHVYYSQEARPYALVSLAIVLSLHSLWVALHAGGRIRWLAFSGFTLLALATHYFAILVLAPAGLLVWLWPADERRAARFRHYVAASVLAAGPWLLWLLWSQFGSPHPRGAHEWIERIWQHLPPVLAIPKSLEVLFLGSQAGLVPGFFKQFTALEFPAWLRAAGLVALASLWLSALAPWGERRLEIPWVSRRKSWLCVLAFFPLLALWLVSLLKPYYVVGRYDLVALPAQLWLLGFGLSKLQGLPRFGTSLAAAVAVVVFGVLGCKLVSYYREPLNPGGPPAPATAAAIASGVGTGDLVLLSPWRGIPVSYYLRQLGYRRRDQICANSDTGHAFLCARVSADDESMVLDFDHLDRVAFSLEATRSDLRALAARVEPGQHVWVEQRKAPTGWLSVTRMIAQELEREGFRPGKTPPALDRLRFRRYERAGNRAP